VYVLALFLSSLFLSHLSLSLLFCQSLSLVLCLSFSLPSLCLTLSLDISMCHARTRARSLALFPFPSFSLSFSVSLHSLAVSFSYSSIHICKYQRWEACMQPHLSGFSLDYSLESISATRFFERAKLNVVEVSHARCLLPVVVQVSYICIHCHTFSVFGEASVWGLFIARCRF